MACGTLEGEAETRAGCPGHCQFKEQKPFLWAEPPGGGLSPGWRGQSGEGTIRSDTEPCPP